MPTDLDERFDDPPYFSEKWWTIFKGVCEDARSLGIFLWFYDQFGFSGANIQARLVTQHPPFAGQALERIACDVEGAGMLEDAPPDGTVLALVPDARTEHGRIEWLRFVVPSSAVRMHLRLHGAATVYLDGVEQQAVTHSSGQEDVYRLGSLCHFDKQVRQRAIDHVLECIQIAQKVDSDIISLWLADGTNYPGQDDLRRRRQRLLDSLQTIYVALPPGMRFLIEYKFFEPAFYSIDLPDWGTSVLMAQKLGPQAEGLVDTGHHPLGTNIAQIVAQLLDEGRLGGFHFNDRKYADDDLIVGSLNPFELFCIFNEIVGASAEGNANAGCIAYMIDQSHNIEPKIEAMIQSVINIQIAYAKAQLVNRVALHQTQESADVLGAYRVLQAAYETDVRPLLAEVRVRQGRDPNPIAAFLASGYAERIVRERVASPVSSDYPGA